MSKSKVIPVHAYSDNYIWLLRITSTANKQHYTTIIDPGIADPVISAIEQQQLTPEAILITHRHHDHIDGIHALKKRYNIPVFGPLHENIAQLDHRLAENDRVQLPQSGAELRVIDVPGHTAGHIAYHYTEDNTDLLFVGDTLFSAGCGRVFDGSATQLHNSLQKLASFPEHSKIYCAHEYTLNNLMFAVTVEPNNDKIVQRLKEVRLLRDENKVTVPSSLMLEKETNPFLRCHITAVHRAVEHHIGHQLNNKNEVFKALRQWKDVF